MHVDIPRWHSVKKKYKWESDDNDRHEETKMKKKLGKTNRGDQ